MNPIGNSHATSAFPPQMMPQGPSQTREEQIYREIANDIYDRLQGRGQERLMFAVAEALHDRGIANVFVITQLVSHIFFNIERRRLDLVFSQRDELTFAIREVLPRYITIGVTPEEREQEDLQNAINASLEEAAANTNRSHSFIPFRSITVYESEESEDEDSEDEESLEKETSISSEPIESEGDNPAVENTSHPVCLDTFSPDERIEEEGIPQRVRAPFELIPLIAYLYKTRHCVAHLTPFWSVAQIAELHPHARTILKVIRVAIWGIFALGQCGMISECMGDRESLAGWQILKKLAVGVIAVGTASLITYLFYQNLVLANACVLADRRFFRTYYSHHYHYDHQNYGESAIFSLVFAPSIFALLIHLLGGIDHFFEAKQSPRRA